MIARCFPCIAFGVALLLGGATAYGAGCVILVAPGAKLVAGPGEYTTHHEFSDCPAGRVMGGSITVCYDRRDGLPACDEVRAGQAFPSPGVLSGTREHGFVQVMRLIVGGDPSSRTGVVRGPGQIPAIAGLPYGDISLTAGDLTLDVPGLTELALFDESRPGPPVFRAQALNGRLMLPSGVLSADRKLRWIAHVPFADGADRVR